MVRVGLEDVPYLEGVMRHPGQEKIHFTDWHRFVANWGRRTGKTIAAAAEVMWVLIQPQTRIWILAPAYDLTDRVFEYVYKWCIEDRVLDKIVGQGAITGSSFPEKGPRYIKTRWGSSVKCRSAESETNIGEQLDLVVIDEAARVPRLVWEQDLEATTTDRKGRALFTSTPRGQNYFFELHQRGETPKFAAMGWASSTFATWENPFMDAGYVREKEQQLPPDVFRREFGASFEHFSGLIYPTFRDSYFDFDSPGTGGHLFNASELRLPLDRLTIYRAGDIGVEHPTYWCWAAVGPLTIGNFQGSEDDVWIFREYMGKSGVPHPEHAKAVRDLSAGLKIYESWLPPDAWKTHKVNEDAALNKSVAEVYQDHGIDCREANNDVRYGIDKVRTYLKATIEDAPAHGRVFISDQCVALRNCKKNYVWQEAAMQRPGKERDSPERPRKYQDDPADGARYLLAMEPRFDATSASQNFYRYGTPDPPPTEKHGGPANVRIMGGLLG